MQGTSLTKQERKGKLYDAFDKFTQVKGETLHKYYLRFTQLINDMNIYNMKMEQFHVNTKFLNSLSPKWSLDVLVFSPGDDPIACLNKAMAFLTVVASSRIIVQQVQGRQGQSYSGTGYKSNATNPGVLDGQAVQTITLNNAAFQTEDLDTYDSGCDDISNAKAVLTLSQRHTMIL
ncbi:hypothetical protein Tco_0506503 [Tanacetum coccineum]